jgi:hypothetical protein
MAALLCQIQNETAKARVFLQDGPGKGTVKPPVRVAKETKHRRQRWWHVAMLLLSALTGPLTGMMASQRSGVVVGFKLATRLTMWADWVRNMAGGKPGEGLPKGGCYQDMAESGMGPWSCILDRGWLVLE